MSDKEHSQQVKNKRRRAALALGATGVAAFFVGKLFGGGSGPQSGEIIGDRRFKGFQISEDKNEMIFADEGGDPIVIIDKQSFKE